LYRDGRDTPAARRCRHRRRLEGLQAVGFGYLSIPAGACQKTALSKVTFKQLTALVIN
jgi:hypothetical protein